MGLTVVPFSAVADLYIINTCTVTHVADKKSRQMIRRARRTNANATIAVCGCGTASNIKIEGTDYVFDARKPEEFLQAIAPAVHSTTASTARAKKTRAFLKVQDGCDRFCTYCIVPHVRGKLYSMPLQQATAQAEALIATGTREIVLTGIQLAAYGENLPTLVQAIGALPGLQRLRLSSLDPWAITDEFLQAIATTPTLCDHFHLSLQHGHDEILHAMNRRYTTHQYTAAASALRSIAPNAAITTDIIVGFPGETEAHHTTNMHYIREINFARIHVFEYSARQGTPAATMPHQTPPQEKTRRSAEIRAIAATLQENFLAAQVGKTAQILWESPTRGNTTNYCPVISKGRTPNEISHEEIISHDKETLLCHPWTPAS
jgi:threonylcarbamoyladenosine tRNA methylthiotransferase MtaB